MAECPEESPALVAWADQFTAEFREESRAEYSRWLNAQGITLVLDEATLEEAYDPILEAGGTAMIEMLARRGCLKREGEE